MTLIARWQAEASGEVADRLSALGEARGKAIAASAMRPMGPIAVGHRRHPIKKG